MPRKKINPLLDRTGHYDPMNLVNPFIFSAPGDVALVASKGVGGGASGGTTAAIDTTGSNFIVIGVSFSAASVGTVVISDSKGNTWTPLTTHSQTGQVGHRLYYCYGPTVGSGHTFTIAGTAIFASLIVSAWSGVATSPFDVENGSSTATFTSLSTGSVTPNQSNSLIITGVGFDPNPGGGSLSVNSGFTAHDTVSYLGSVHWGLGMAYKIVTSAAAANPAWSLSATGGAAASSIVVFKD